MKNVLLQFSLLILLICCNTANSTASMLFQNDQVSQPAFNGNWEITDITFPGSGTLNVNTFQIADTKCFIASTWNFNSSANNGSIKLNASGCPSFNSDIEWSINKDGNFAFRITGPGVKTKADSKDFILKVSNQTTSSFQLTDVVSIDGTNKEIVYYFEKIFEFR